MVELSQIIQMFDALRAKQDEPQRWLIDEDIQDTIYIKAFQNGQHNATQPKNQLRQLLGIPVEVLPAGIGVGDIQRIILYGNRYCITIDKVGKHSVENLKYPKSSM